VQISLTYKSKQIFWLVIKLIIVFGCGFFIYQKLFLHTEISFFDLTNQLQQNHFFSFQYIALLLILSVLNWFFEILKWQQLVSSIKNISFADATIQCLSSLTTSLITPNRIGEYGAKAIYFKKSLRKKIVGLNFIGNFYQLLATLFFGITGFLFFILTNKININFSSVFGVFFVLILFFGFFYLLINSLQFGRKYLQKIKTFIGSISFKTNIKTAFLSFVRYLIFSHQFYFLILLFSIDVNYINAISAITSMYFIASIVPMLSFFDVVLKGSIAVWVFSFFNIEPTFILIIVSLMWILNFAIPAIVGSYFVITFKQNSLE